ncbi:MAG: asparagine synthase (glutamine-hydrolyzing) [Acidobacteriaceae bacterium]
MCGIVGYTTKDWYAPVERIRDAAMTLVHRGPDQQGTHHSALCSLAGARLKILDLSAGDQPIYSPDRNTVIVFNGEIYNHLELRQELAGLGHRFESTCDTETLLHAFLEWDTDCFARLRGMFGVALWQQKQRRLVLARDRVGIKPLYIARQGEDVLFASELKGILIHPEFERRLSLQGLDCYLSMNYVPSPWTLVEGVEKLTPGHWLEWRNGTVRTESYWEIPEIRPERISLEDAKEELDRLLTESVAEQMLSDVPLGVWLSGGMDSSTILHYAARASRESLRTFSISFQGRSFDESAYIGEMARQYGTRHEQLDLNLDQDLEGAIRELTYYSDEPSADSGALPVWFLSKLTRQSCTVAFSGEGSDEIFGGYLTYRANRMARWARHLPDGVIQTLLHGLKAWPASDEKIGLDYKVKRLLEGSLLPPEESHIFWNGTFSAAEKAALVRKPLPGALQWLLSSLKADLPGDGLGPYMKFDQEYYLTDDILVKSDRMSMAHSIEVRPPFLDHRLIEFAAKLPAKLKIQGSRQKVLLKELMRDKLPPTILQRKKVGFDIPAHEWFRGPLRELLMETLESGEAEYGELFRFDKIYDLTQLHMNRSINIGFHLWGLMVLFLWMKEWKIQSAPQLRPSAAMIALKG